MNPENDDKTKAYKILTKDSIVNHYRIEEKIGEGGMGEVFLATDTKLGRKVALKFLPAHNIADTEIRSRFTREAQAVAKIHHPNIITIFEVSEFNSCPFLAMELVEGKDLQNIIADESLSIETAVEYAIQICEGLAAAHNKNIIHRDIKPANIVIDSYGKPKILDFGLAVINDGEQLTHAGTILGTFRYMSPEQVEGTQIDHRSDLFSFGVLFYEMLTKVSPFAKDSQAATLKSIISDKPEDIIFHRSDISSDLQNIVNKLLEKEVNSRFQTAYEVIESLKNLSDEVSTNNQTRKSIAVLAFENMSNDPEQEFFCDGITEDILNDLAQVDDLRVVSRTSSFSFKGKNEDLRVIGKKLNANTILEGSVRKAGNKIRLTAQLINVEDGYHIWSKRFDRELDDIFAIQDEISESIVKALKLQLNPINEVNKDSVPTSNMDAYELYLRARTYLHNSGKKNIGFAIELFSKAIEKDPSYAHAFAGLSYSLTDKYFYVNNDPAIINGAIEASLKALELNPKLADAHTAYGYALSVNNKYKEASEEFEKAIELNHNLFEAYYLYARSSWASGDHRKASELFLKANQIKPDDYQTLVLAGNCFGVIKEPERKKEIILNALNIINKRLDLVPDDIRAIYLGAGIYVELGAKEKALEWIDKATKFHSDAPDVFYNFACIYALLEKVEECFSQLEKAIQLGFSHKEWLENDSDLESIRSHPRYKSLLELLDSKK